MAHRRGGMFFLRPRMDFEPSFTPFHVTAGAIFHGCPGPDPENPRLQKIKIRLCNRLRMAMQAACHESAVFVRPA
jgi:hypothetical protein